MTKIKHCSAQSVQTAIYQTLTEVFGNDCVIYDSVPENAAYPFGHIGNISTSDVGTKTECIDEVTVNVQLFSQSKGKKQVEELTDTAFAALSAMDVQIDSFWVSFDSINTEIAQITDTVYTSSMTAVFRAVQGE